jgi:hypothetical protein
LTEPSAPRKQNVAKVTSKMVVIPGHGGLANQADLVLFRDVPVEMRDKISALKKQDKSLAEVIAAKPGLARTTNGESPSRGLSTLLLWCAGASEKSAPGPMCQEIW